MNKIIILTVAAVLLISSVQADDFSKVGTAGAQFLKIGVGARYNSLGEASVALSDDIYAMYWNPAGLTGIENNEMAFTYVNYLLDVNLNYIAFARRFEDFGVLGVSATMLSMGEQEITTYDEPDGTGDTYTASSYAFQVSYAKDLTANFSFGASVKFIGEKIYRETANGFAFDFGTMLYTGFRSLRLGMNISNMGPEMSFDGPDLTVGYDPGVPDPTSEEENNSNFDPYSANINTNPYDIPLTFRVGVAYDFLFGDASKLILAMEAKHPNDNVQQGALGAEYDWQGKYFLRAGYKLNYEEEGLSLGGGLKTNLTGGTDLTLDYAWMDFGRLNSVHRFSASINF
ncbi:MAG: PorV/PorQ family protein [Candidatus Zixiibacteriota bacterium]